MESRKGQRPVEAHISSWVSSLSLHTRSARKLSKWAVLSPKKTYVGLKIFPFQVLFHQNAGKRWEKTKSYQLFGPRVSSRTLKSRISIKLNQAEQSVLNELLSRIVPVVSVIPGCYFNSRFFLTHVRIGFQVWSQPDPNCAETLNYILAEVSLLSTNSKRFIFRARVVGVIWMVKTTTEKSNLYYVWVSHNLFRISSVIFQRWVHLILRFNFGFLLE